MKRNRRKFNHEDEHKKKRQVGNIIMFSILILMIAFYLIYVNGVLA